MQGILKQLGKHQGKVNDVMVTSNSNTVVSAGDDRLVMVETEFKYNHKTHIYVSMIVRLLDISRR